MIVITRPQADRGYSAVGLARCGPPPGLRRCADRLRLVTERTLVLVKPDGVGRKLVGEVVSRIERKGLDLVALDLRTVDRELASQHYAEHDGKPFFESLLEFITSGPVIAAVVEGPRAIAAWRQIAGGTDPVEKAAPGSIRGDFALETQNNLVHGSDSPESAAREIKLWFPAL
jgi:nucleoside-diphosphate kinase